MASPAYDSAAKTTGTHSNNEIHRLTNNPNDGLFSTDAINNTSNRQQLIPVRHLYKCFGTFTQNYTQVTRR